VDEATAARGRRVDRQGRRRLRGVPPDRHRAAREAIAGILIRALTLYSGGRTGASARFGDEIASLVLRGLLTEPATLEAVRRDAQVM
jgi:hypothetical protein